MSTKDAITHAELLELLNYNPETGVFTWIKTYTTYAVKGKRAGGYEQDGYRRIKIKGKSYKEHRLAWFYVHNTWPKDQIDHINGKRDDNRLTNLREATTKENHQNRHSNRTSTSKYLGVSLDSRSGKYKVGITVNKVRTHIGYFATEEEAFAAYSKAKQALHIFNPTPLPPISSE